MLDFDDFRDTIINYMPDYSGEQHFFSDYSVGLHDEDVQPCPDAYNDKLRLSNEKWPDRHVKSDRNAEGQRPTPCRFS